MAIKNTVMKFGDDEGNQVLLDQRIKARVVGQNLIFYIANSESELPVSYSEEQQKEYHRAKILGFKGTITEYFSIRDYT